MRNNPMPTPTPESADTHPALHQALAQVLPPPALPSGFRAQLLAAVHREGLHNLAHRRQALEREHALALQQLQRGHVHLKRDTLAMVVATAFTAGTLASLALPWLQETFEFSGAVAMPLLAIAIGMMTGASVWWDRLGRAR